MTTFEKVPDGLRVGYLTNVYPAVSHSFIKREILALEARGCAVHRWSIRPFADNFPDPGDQLEATRTEVILAHPAAILVAVLGAFALTPLRAWKAARASLEGRTSGLGTMVRRLAHFAEACYLARAAKRAGIEHLHAHFGTNPASVARLAHLLGGPPYSFTVHGPDEFDQPIVHNIAAKVSESRFAAAISNFGKSQLMRWTDPRFWGQIDVVRCGLDETFLAERDEAQKRSPTMQLCCVARLAPQKGLPVLVDAAERLKREGVQFKIVVIGDGPLRGWLEKAIRERDLAAVFELKGWASAADVRDALLESRAMVLPSFAEGLPVVIMEALALEIPVISTRIAGIGELVDSECGWMIDAGEAGQLAEAMKAALSADAETLQRLGRVGRARTLAMHDASKNAARLLSLILAARSTAAGTD